MSGSRIPGSMGRQLFLSSKPSRTPGPLGINDAADPNVEAIRGDTPGTLGLHDGTDPNAVFVASSHPLRRSSPSPPLARVVVSVDNYHSLYIAKSASAVTQVTTGTVSNPTPAQSVYQYDLDLSEVSCLYIAAWSDHKERQGLLATIVNWFKPKILSGGPEWEVFPTKAEKRGPGGTPTVGEVQNHIATATWQTPAGGEPNTEEKEHSEEEKKRFEEVTKRFEMEKKRFEEKKKPSEEVKKYFEGKKKRFEMKLFKVVPACDASAKWIWCGSEPYLYDRVYPFHPGWNHGEYLLFRVCAPKPKATPKFPGARG